MSDITIAWVEELEVRYGVQPEFTRRLSPILECLAGHALGDHARADLFAAIAASYRRSLAREPRRDSLEEVRLLVTQFITELRKMEESLKVLDVMLQRVRAQVEPATRPRLLN